MIRIDVNANHGAGMPLSKAIDLTALPIFARSYCSIWGR